LSLPSVEKVQVVKTPSAKSSKGKLDFLSFPAGDPLAYQQPIIMLNGMSLHNKGYTGKGMLIAVLDGGFSNADKVRSLAALNARKGIRSTYDFVNRNPFVYSFHNHGTAVLSVLAGTREGSIAGTAPSADYILLRTEDTMTEFPVEEDFWAAGAEFADSVGADIISSSLGYFRFDDPSMDYRFADMNGITTFVTRAAEIAASKGIMVFASAGNERNDSWQRIIAPSDGTHVIAVGAVNSGNIISGFSSAGPSADGRIKPDNTAMGVLVPVESGSDTIILSSGTSFSCPVLSGMSACLLQAVPVTGVSEIIFALHRSGDRYLNPDSLYGYGTPDMLKALTMIEDDHTIKPEGDVIISPNPSAAGIDIIFRVSPGNTVLELFSSSGRMLLKKSFTGMTGRVIHLDEFQQAGQGIYFIRLTTGNNTFVKKVVKLKD
jgi:subtilisin family serine protease